MRKLSTSVERYLQIIENLSDPACVSRAPDGGEVRDEGLGLGTRYIDLRDAMLQARIIEFEPRHFEVLRKEIETWIDARITTDLGPPDIALGSIAVSHREKLTASTPFPRPLPFPFTFLVYGNGFPLSPEETIFHGLERGRSPVLDEYWHEGRLPRVIGHLLCEDGEAVEFVSWDLSGIPLDESGLLLLTIASASKGWWFLASPCPLVLNGLIAVINEHRSLVIQDHTRKNSYRRSFKMAAKRFGIRRMTPRPYYRMVLGDRTIVQLAASAAFPKVDRTFSHRWDVRAHERIYVRRGLLVHADSLTQIEHHKRLGYRVYTQRPLPDEDLERLLYRGHMRPRAGEWIAVKHKMIDAHIKGPDQMPYVPAMRVVTDIPGALL